MDGVAVPVLPLCNVDRCTSCARALAVPMLHRARDVLDHEEAQAIRRRMGGSSIIFARPKYAALVHANRRLQQHDH